MKVAVLVVLAIVGRSGHAQRVKKGCYDAFPVSCDGPPPPADDNVSSASSDVDAEIVCTQLAVDVFPTTDIFFDTDRHSDFLNGIDSTDPFCAAIVQVYHECIWCAPAAMGEEEGTAFMSDCENEAFWQVCGGKPTLDELLQSDNEAYPDFSSQDDIDAVCAKLEEAYKVTLLSDTRSFGFPSTMDLCHKQAVVKHLCPGYCEGGCFDGPEGIPPSCEPYQGLVDPEVEEWRVCDAMDYDIMYFMPDLDAILNVSQHADYLKAISGNTTECQAAQQAYSQCYWCASEGDFCFDAERPPTCEAPSAADAQLLQPQDDWADPYDICFALYNPLVLNYEYGPDYYNVSVHHEALLYRDNTSFCEQAHYQYHQCMWCHNASEYDVNFCQSGAWCDSNVTIPADYVLPDAFQSLNLSALALQELLPNETLKTCANIYDEWQEGWYDTTLLSECYKDLWVHRQCPQEFCSFEAAQLNLNYLGASTDRQKRALVWASRSSAMLSFLGAIFILYDILNNAKKRVGVYYQLLIGMAIFDIVTASAWCLATLPLNEDEAHYVLGAAGTEATCKTQAFFIQLGFTSVFYNVSLAAYYVLVVAYGWKEFQLRPLRRYLHGIPLLVGLGLAAGGIPSYHWIEYGCHLETLPDADLWMVMVFVVAPLGFSILSITLSMLVVYYTVHEQSHQAKKWRLGSSKKKRSVSLEQEVFWQCVFYVLAFYISWPILFSVYLKSIDVGGPIGLTLTVAFVAPLQGKNTNNKPNSFKLHSNLISFFWIPHYRIQQLSGICTTENQALFREEVFRCGTNLTYCATTTFGRTEVVVDAARPRRDKRRIHRERSRRISPGLHHGSVRLVGTPKRCIL